MVKIAIIDRWKVVSAATRAKKSRFWNTFVRKMAYFWSEKLKESENQAYWDARELKSLHSRILEDRYGRRQRLK